MERLTERYGDGYIGIKGCTSCYRDMERKSTPAANAIVRLAAYEDTGLTPEEIMERIAPQLNAPLTLEELLEMELFEWLWVEVVKPIERKAFHKLESAYYQVFEDYTGEEALCCGCPGLIHEFEYADYGKAWLAYRRKPEEGAT